MPVLAALVAAAFLPGFTITAIGPHGGEFWTGAFPGTERPGEVYLPPAFDPAQRYPVVYLLHGMPGSPSEYLSGTNLLSWADEAIVAHTIRPFIAVVPAAGPDRGYDGEWAGPWEAALVEDVVPWVDATLPTIRSARGRVLAGLSAGGFGAADIGLRHPGLFGTIESWSGYFTPLHDGPFRDATRATLDLNDPMRLAPAEAARLRRLHTRVYLSSGPYHSHWFRPAQTITFARELEQLGVTTKLDLLIQARGEWSAQLDAGLDWAFAT